MRRLARLCFAFLAASIVFPVTATWAGAPGAGLRNAGNPFPKRDSGVEVARVPAGTVHHHAGQPAGGGIILHTPTHNHDARCMCPDCQVKRAIEEAEGMPVIIQGPGPQTGASVVGAPGVPCAACQGSEAPGYASLGGGAGYARLGGTGLASTEPAPIGVVRTNYAGGSSPAGAPPADPSIAAFHQAARSAAPSQSLPMAGPWVSKPARRPSLLGNVLGYSTPLSRWRSAREAQRAEAHAAIPMGMPTASGRVSELPASMVYGR